MHGTAAGRVGWSRCCWLRIPNDFVLQRNTTALAEAVDLASGCIDVVCMPLCMYV